MADMAGAAQTSQQAETEAGWEDDFGWDGEDGGGGSGSNGAASGTAGVQDGAEGAPLHSALASPVHRAGRVQGSGDSWNDW
jgi:hypothetical protein